MEFYLSTKGSFMGDGSKENPFLTLDQAKYKIRQLKYLGKLSNHNTVWIDDGIYSVNNTVVFTEDDNIPVTYRAMPDCRPIFDAGRRIEGFSETIVNGVKAWRVYLPEVAERKWNFNQLFVNDVRASKSRFPKKDYFFIEGVPGKEINHVDLFDGSSSFIYKDGDINPNWKNIADIEILVFHRWIEERMPIKYIDERKRLLKSTRKSAFVLTDELTKGFSKYFVENVFEELKEPGEFYLDKTDGFLYYVPRDGETIETAKIYAPIINQVIKIEGDLSKNSYVENIAFKGLTFRHGGWEWPSAKDAIDYRRQFEWQKGTGFRNIMIKFPYSNPSKQEGDSLNDGEEDYANMLQGSSHVPGFISMKGVKNIIIQGCRIEHTGYYGTELDEGSFAVKILGNEINDLGGGGIKIDGGSSFNEKNTHSGYHQISDNDICFGGNVFYSSIGVLMTHVHNTTVSHNNIHDFYYSGVSCGWIWGYAESICRNNIISYNHIYNLGKNVLSDMGGIYTLGMQPGTEITNNLIHDINCYGYGGWGIYPDEGSSHLVIENNICYNFNSNCFHQHYGRENTVRNNIFVNGKEAVIAISRKEDHISCSFYNNIFVSMGEPVFKVQYEGMPSQKTMKSNANIIYGAKGDVKMLNNEDLSIDDWQNELGFDRNSIFVDPMFKNLDEHDFTLSADSPAYDVGFVEIDIKDVGPRKIVSN